MANVNKQQQEGVDPSSQSARSLELLSDDLSLAPQPAGAAAAAIAVEKQSSPEPSVPQERSAQRFSVHSESSSSLQSKQAAPAAGSILGSISGVLSVINSFLPTELLGGAGSAEKGASETETETDAGYNDVYDEDEGDRADFVYLFSEAVGYPDEPGTDHEDEEGGGSSKSRRSHSWPIDRNFIVVSDEFRRSTGRWATINLFRRRQAQMRAAVRNNEPVQPLPMGNDTVCLIRAARGALDHVLGRGGDLLRQKRVHVYDAGSVDMNGMRIHPNATAALQEIDELIQKSLAKNTIQGHHILISLAHFYQTLAPDVITFIQTVAVVHDSVTGARSVGFSAPIQVTEHFDINQEYAEWLDKGADGRLHPARILAGAIVSAAADLYRRSKTSTAVV